MRWGPFYALMGSEHRSFNTIFNSHFAKCSGLRMAGARALIKIDNFINFSISLESSRRKRGLRIFTNNSFFFK